MSESARPPFQFGQDSADGDYCWLAGCAVLCCAEIPSLEVLLTYQPYIIHSTYNYLARLRSPVLWDCIYRVRVVDGIGGEVGGGGRRRG